MAHQLVNLACLANPSLLASRTGDNGTGQRQSLFKHALKFAEIDTTASGTPLYPAHETDRLIAQKGPEVPVLAPLPVLLLRNIDEQHNVNHLRPRKRQRRG